MRVMLSGVGQIQNYLRRWRALLERRTGFCTRPVGPKGTTRRLTVNGEGGALSFIFHIVTVNGKICWEIDKERTTENMKK